MINRFVYAIDQLSRSVGHAFAWCIIILTFGTSYEVFMRYVLNDPTACAFDLSYLMYGALFFMGGAYTLSRDAHVRGDVFYRLWAPRTQAWLEVVLYILFFFPGVVSLMIAGGPYAYDSFRIREASVNSPIGVPVWPLKMLLPVAGLLLTLQGIAEILRCVLCIRNGRWPQRLHDVEEMEIALMSEKEELAKGEAAAPAGGAG